MAGAIASINVSARKGVRKSPVAEANLKADHGIVGDVHAGPGDWQVSLLALESIEAQKKLMEAKVEAGKAPVCPQAGELIRPGAYAENVTTKGIDPERLSLGTRLRVGDEVILEISKIGKKCHEHCEIYMIIGDCIMPREGRFARVLRGGRIKVGDEVRVDTNSDRDG